LFVPIPENTASDASWRRIFQEVIVMFSPFLTSPALAASSSFGAWTAGAVTGLGLFAVVGAQSAFVLRQGLLRTHILSVLITCGLVDAGVILASVLGLQAVMAYMPGLAAIMLVAGGLFLLGYGLRSAHRAWRPRLFGAVTHGTAISRGATIVAALGFSLLNPHFWLDMLVVGSVAHGFGDARLAFAGGAFMASIFWLVALSLGARLLAPWFSRPGAWRTLDAVIAVVMIGLAIRLLAGAVTQGAAPV
jgi:L-lysine exporter family protein LysE/ArgO